MTDPAYPFDPPTELVVAAIDVTLCAEFGAVTHDKRARLLLAAQQLPTEGLARAWYNLRDLAIRYVEDHASKSFAPRFNFGGLVNAAVNAGVTHHHHWQDVFE